MDDASESENWHKGLATGLRENWQKGSIMGAVVDRWGRIRAVGRPTCNVRRLLKSDL